MPADPALPGLLNVPVLADPGMHGDARRDRDVDTARRSELGNRHGQRRARPGVVTDAGTFLPEDQQAVPRQRRLLEPGTLSTATTVRPAPAAKLSRSAVRSWWHSRW